MREVEAEELVDRYLNALRASPDLDDERLRARLIDAGATPDEAALALELVPSAFCRRWAPLGVRFSDEYVSASSLEADADLRRGTLTDYAVFVAARARASSCTEQALIEGVASRGPEHGAITMALAEGAQPIAILLEPQYFVALPSSAAVKRAIVQCEVCGLTHEPTALACEDCGHSLGKSPDWIAIRGQYRAQRGNAIIALTLVIANIVLCFALLGGAGIILMLAPFTWLVRSAYRARVLSKALDAQLKPGA